MSRDLPCFLLAARYVTILALGFSLYKVGALVIGPLQEIRITCLVGKAPE